MKHDDFAIIEMLTFIYEDMDIDAIEMKFVELVSKLFSFNKVGLFFLKHKKGVLQGKLCKGFDEGQISSLEIPLQESNLLTKPLITGFPIWGEEIGNDPYISNLQLNDFAIIPIISKKRVPCWEIKNCDVADCPAYGKKWLRCWLVSNTKCSEGYKLLPAEKKILCQDCMIFDNMTKDASVVEGILLVNNPDPSDPISNSTITTLSAISYAVGIAINNSKIFSRTLQFAIKDELTGLHNRRYFNERLIDELERARRYDEKLSIVLVDIDHFKKVNDTYGHPVGDKMLFWLGKSFQKQFRHNDVIARYGGEEFSILLLNTSKEMAFNLANKTRAFIEDNSEKETGLVKITCSFGLATYGEDSNSLEGLISKADKALYYAKAQGRNKVCSAK